VAVVMTLVAPCAPEITLAMPSVPLFISVSAPTMVFSLAAICLLFVFRMVILVLQSLSFLHISLSKPDLN